MLQEIDGNIRQYSTSSEPAAADRETRPRHIVMPTTWTVSQRWDSERSW